MRNQTINLSSINYFRIYRKVVGNVVEVVCSATWQNDHACQFYLYNFSLQFAWAPARVAIACSYFFVATNILSNSQLAGTSLRYVPYQVVLFSTMW